MAPLITGGCFAVSEGYRVRVTSREFAYIYNLCPRKSRSFRRGMRAERLRLSRVVRLNRAPTCIVVLCLGVANSYIQHLTSPSLDSNYFADSARGRSDSTACLRPSGRRSGAEHGVECRWRDGCLACVARFDR